MVSSAVGGEFLWDLTPANTDREYNDPASSRNCTTSGQAVTGVRLWPLGTQAEDSPAIPRACHPLRKGHCGVKGTVAMPDSVLVEVVLQLEGSVVV